MTPDGQLCPRAQGRLHWRHSCALSLPPLGWPTFLCDSAPLTTPLALHVWERAWPPASRFSPRIAHPGASQHSRSWEGADNSQARNRGTGSSISMWATSAAGLGLAEGALGLQGVMCQAHPAFQVSVILLMADGLE